MTALALVTWLAIGVLIFGSSAVFIWFLFDIRKVLRADVPRSTEKPEKGGSDMSAP